MKPWLLPSVLSFFLGALSTIASEADYAAQELCSNNWREQVSVIREVVSAGLPRHVEVYFVGLDGNTFDCLGGRAPGGVRIRAEASNKLIAEIQARMAREEGRLPTNFCSTSSSMVGTFQVVGVHLPYEVERLNSADCQKRLRNLKGSVERWLGRAN